MHCHPLSAEPPNCTVIVRSISATARYTAWVSPECLLADGKRRHDGHRRRERAAAHADGAEAICSKHRELAIRPAALGADGQHHAAKAPATGIQCGRANNNITDRLRSV